MAAAWPGLPEVPPGALSRRRWLQAAAGWAGLGTAAASSAATLPAAVSLPDELAQAIRMGQPLVVMVSLDGCPFCRVARDSYLAPLREQQGLPVVQIDMRSQRLVQDFAGTRLSHDAISRRWGIRVAPTVLFFGRAGQEVAERLIGGYLPDFYGAYLDERLSLSRAALR